MSLATIGQKLKSAREAQGLSLVQVYERTKIPMNHLQAVEQGETDELPEPVFIFGFIKRYAECCGLDGQILADDYRQHIEKANGNGKRNNKDNATPYYASNDYMQKSKIRVSTPTYKLWVFNALIIIGVVGTITWFINAQQSSLVNQTDPALVGLRSATNRLTPTAPPMPNQPAQTAQQAVPAQDLSQKVTLSATRHVWVEVKRISNGESIFTGYLEQGDRRDFEDPSGLIVRAGDGGSLSVDRQGKIETFGLNGKVVERQFISAQPAGTVVTPAAVTSATGTGVVRSTAPVVRRPRRVNTEASRPRQVDTRRVDSGPREVPSRYSEGRLDSD